MNNKIYEHTRDEFSAWHADLKENLLLPDSSLMHTYRIAFPDDDAFINELENFAKTVAFELEPVVTENNLDDNLPQLQQYDAIGDRCDRVLHHPSYVKAGDLIYGSGLMGYLKQPGQMLKMLSLFLLSSHAGEAGHNCPIACSAGVMRVLSKYADVNNKEAWLDKLAEPSFKHNFTGAQFLTEIQGGSDVGANAAEACLDDQNQWRIRGEKWFCSNANAELILMTARFNPSISGTKGLGLFLVPANLPDGRQNHYHIRRLKQKIGTRSMATAEIDFIGAVAYPMGELQLGINLVMENVLHLSRIFNAFSVLGMARRAFQIAYYYAVHRKAFEHRIIDYPLVKELLAKIKADNTAMLASVFHMVRLQDDYDSTPVNEQSKEQQLLLRTLANVNKYYTAKRSVENIHHCLDVLAGNGTIESFSTLPRLLRDCIVCENWEGTHFVLWMQILKDIHKFNVDELYFAHLNSLLDEMGTDSEFKLLLSEKMDDLQRDVQQLKAMPFEEQTLAFKRIAEGMGTLLSSLTLALELQKNKPSNAKQAAMRLFININLEEKHQGFNDYVFLLNAVLE